MFLNQDFNTCLDELAQTGATIKEKGISPDSQEAKAMFKKVQDKYEIYPRPDLTQGILEKFGLKKANY